MRLVFIDTSFLIASVASDDQHHGAAAAWQKRLGGVQFVTTEFVLLEVLNGLSDPGRRDVGIGVLESLRASRRTTIVPCSPQLLEQGVALFRERSDKAWGLTDCTSFVVMRQRGLMEALTADIHFQQAGFRALLRDE